MMQAQGLLLLQTAAAFRCNDFAISARSVIKLLFGLISLLIILTHIAAKLILYKLLRIYLFGMAALQTADSALQIAACSTLALALPPPGFSLSAVDNFHSTILGASCACICSAGCDTSAPGA